MNTLKYINLVVPLLPLISEKKKYLIIKKIFFFNEKMSNEY